ncbi:MAG: endonuclease III domain-containing protein [Nitrospirae bacterium]|nr:endonuclease III domain-containing protein [Nitrospirota bacterium]
MRKTQPAKILIEIYRTLFNAFGPQHWWPGETPFEVAVGAILTQNTNWGNVEKAINNLKTQKVLDPVALHKMPAEKLALLVRPSGYYNIKAKRLKAFLNYFVIKYKGSMKNLKDVDMQTLRKELLGIHGIGPETADSILLYALEKPVFVIDAYTKRALARHGIVSANAAYQDIQLLFHDNLPRDTVMYNEYHALFVKLGKDFCRPKPGCGICPLREMDK